MTWSRPRVRFVSRHRGRLRPAASVLALLLLGGCTGQGRGEAGNAEKAAVEFSRSVDSSADAACRLLAPQTLAEVEDGHGPCAGSLPEELSEEPSKSGAAQSV